MLQGKDLWDGFYTEGLKDYNYKGRTVLSYDDEAKNMFDMLKRSAGRYPDKVAIVGDDGAEFTYAQFLQLVEQYAKYLHFDRGIGAGDMIALIIRNSIDFCIAAYAASRLRAVFVPVSTKYKPTEWIRLMEDLPVKLVLLERTYEHAKEALLKAGVPAVDIVEKDTAFEALLAQKEYSGEPEQGAQWEDDAIIMHTSGTTGKSKGVVMTNFNVVNAVITYERTMRVTNEDTSVIATPIYHITGLIAVMALLIHTGGTIYLHGMFDAARVLKCAADHNLTLYHASPTVFYLLLEQRKNFPKLPAFKKFACGSANMPVRAIRELHDWMPQMVFHTVYGLTESTSAGTAFPVDAATSEKIGASGLPTPPLEIKVVDDDGNELQRNEAGELCMRGSFMLDRYYNLETDTLGEDGWFMTGDIARIDEDGYVYIIDRKKDMINRGGEKVWSIEVENEICLMPQVEETAVIGVPDEKYGETVMALVKPVEGQAVTLGEVREWLLPRLAKYKLPTYVVSVDEIEKSNNKVDKRALRNKYGSDEYLKKL